MKNIHIPQPCPEKWASMTPTENGATCSKCSTEVLDFTNLTPEEIKASLIKAKGNRVCAKMNSDQESVPEIPFELFNQNNINGFRRTFIYALVMVFGLSLFGCDSDEYEGPVGMVEYEVGDVEYEPDTIDSDLSIGQVKPNDSLENEILKSTVSKMDSIVEPLQIRLGLVHSYPYDDK